MSDTVDNSWISWLATIVLVVWGACALISEPRGLSEVMASYVTALAVAAWLCAIIIPGVLGDLRRENAELYRELREARHEARYCSSCGMELEP